MAITKVTRTLLSTGIDDQSNATAITIDSSENVGIGCTPHFNFDVQLNSSRRIGFNYSDSQNTILSHDGSGNIETLGLRGNTILFYSDYDVSNPDGVERMRIDASGRLGIGTTDPQAELHVSNGSAGFEFKPDGISDGISYMQVYDRVAGSYDALRYYAAEHYFHIGNNEKMRIDSGGRVMIAETSNSGYSANADDLIVGDNGSATERGISIGSTAGGSIRFNDGGDAGVVEYVHSDNSMRFYVNGNETVRINNDTGTSNARTLVAGGNGGITFGSSFTGAAAGFGSAVDNANNEGVEFIFNSSLSEWQPAGIIAQCVKIDTNQGSHAYGRVSYGFSTFNGSLGTVQKYEDDGTGVTWSLNDLGGTSQIKIQVKATTSGTLSRLVISAWGMAYSGVSAAGRIN